MGKSAKSVSVKKVRPLELKRPLLSNPGKGCATFQRFNGDPVNQGERWSEEGPLTFPRARQEVADHYLPSSVSYCRWFWEVLEPREGVFDWRMVRGALRTARRRGQTLQVRLMPFGAHGQPQLPRWYIRKYRTRTGTTKGRSYVYLEPAYEREEYYATWGRVIQGFAEEFDGHPGLESVDIAFIGPWGEGAGDMSVERVERFVDLYVSSHLRTPLLINTDGDQFAAGARRATGWRCDCFGDLRSDGPNYMPGRTGWNHTFDCYPQAVARAGAADLWKTRPVVFETCSVPLTWHRRGYDLDLIMQQGYKFHASVFMPKSNPIPPAYMKPLAEFCDRIGYRFVLRQARWETPVRFGRGLSMQLWIENTGVAPIYRRYRLAFRLTKGRQQAVVTSAADVRSWLPGDACLEEVLAVPRRLGRGTMNLAVGLVDPVTLRPAVRFANERGLEDGWVPLDTVTVR